MNHALHISVGVLYGVQEQEFVGLAVENIYADEVFM